MIPANYQKTYLTRSMTKAMSMDHPIGDPFGGPAYGERREPVSAIAAVVSIAVGGSAVAAATAVTFTAVMGGLMIAGGAASLIGNISGNKKLQMIGNVVAGAAGLGMAGASLFSEAAVQGTTAAAGATGSVADDVAVAATALDEPVLLSSNGATAGAAAADDVVGTVASAANPAPLANTTVATTAPVDGLISSNASLVDDVAAPLASTNTVSTATSNAPLATEFGTVADEFATSVANAPAPVDANTSYLDSVRRATEAPVATAATPAAPTAAAPAPSATNPGLLKNAGKFIKDNKEVISIGGQLVQGVADYAFPSQSTQAQTDLYNASAALRDAQADQLAYEKNRPQRLAAAYQNVNYRPIAGLINNARG